MANVSSKSTALTGFLNCNGIPESLDEIPLNSSICGLDEFLEMSWVYESGPINDAEEAKRC